MDRTTTSNLAALLLAGTLGTLTAQPVPARADEPTITIARADGEGHVNVDIVYYRDLGCTFIKDVKEGAPSDIEGPKRTLVVTVTIDRKGDSCDLEQKADPVIRQSIRITDRPKALSVDIFYRDVNGTFVRSQRPPIYRPGDED